MILSIVNKYVNAKERTGFFLQYTVIAKTPSYLGVYKWAHIFHRSSICRFENPRMQKKPLSWPHLDQLDLSSNWPWRVSETHRGCMWLPMAFACLRMAIRAEIILLLVLGKNWRWPFIPLLGILRLGEALSVPYKGIKTSFLVLGENQKCLFWAFMTILRPSQAMDRSQKPSGWVWRIQVGPDFHRFEYPWNLISAGILGTR